MTRTLHCALVPAGVGMMAQVEGDEQEMDAVLAALHLAAEDDAIKTRTHIPLPVDMFSSRLDNMVTVSEQGTGWWQVRRPHCWSL